MDQVSLGDAVLAGVVGAPPGELRRLSGCAEQRAPGRRGETAVLEQRRNLAIEIADDGLADVSAAVLVVQPAERRCHLANRVNVGLLDGAVTVACKGSAIAGREPPQRRKGVAGRAECGGPQDIATLHVTSPELDYVGHSVPPGGRGRKINVSVTAGRCNGGFGDDPHRLAGVREGTPATRSDHISSAHQRSATARVGGINRPSDTMAGMRWRILLALVVLVPVGAACTLGEIFDGCGSHGTEDVTSAGRAASVEDLAERAGRAHGYEHH